MISQEFSQSEGMDPEEQLSEVKINSELDEIAAGYFASQAENRAGQITRRLARLQEMDDAVRAIAEGQPDIVLPTPLHVAEEIESRARLEKLEARAEWTRLDFPKFMPVLDRTTNLTPLPMVMIDPRYLSYNLKHTTLKPPYDNCFIDVGIGGGTVQVPQYGMLLDGKLGSVGLMKAAHPKNVILTTEVIAYLNLHVDIAEMAVQFNLRWRMDSTVVGVESSFFDVSSILTCSVYKSSTTPVVVSSRKVLIEQELQGKGQWNFHEDETRLAVIFNMKVPNNTRQELPYVFSASLVQMLIPYISGSGSLWSPVTLDLIQVIEFLYP